LLRELALRALLLAAPFVVWFIWRDVAIRTGRPMGATPWTWLVAAGAVLVGLSLMATAFTHNDSDGRVYVPAEATPSGAVTPGHFEAARPAK
jgi:hypothetical protein